MTQQEPRTDQTMTENSMEYPLNSRDTNLPIQKRFSIHSGRRPPSPAPSMVSMRSDNSMGGRRPPSPAPSMVSMRRDNSMGYPPNLRERMILKKDISQSFMRGKKNGRLVLPP
ncbi:hypothetical protein AALO_G00203460 [Alosa alosa]|uniref:Uncharacterized protein n=1 Tax=Alosa alosa TaxID=278164 RepID=A0AAV6G3P4_9TELE|nr:hypothetical protein AALO_G00203460 [Alosa alosa]